MSREAVAAALPELRRLGVHVIKVHYSGYGDSGQVDYIEYADDDGQSTASTVLTAYLEQHRIDNAVDELVWELLPPGFEINEGSQGTVEIYTETLEVVVNHGENYMETRHETFTHQLDDVPTDNSINEIQEEEEQPETAPREAVPRVEPLPRRRPEDPIVDTQEVQEE